MERFDSQVLFSIFKNDEGENLLPFDDLAELLQMEMTTPVSGEGVDVAGVGSGAAPASHFQMGPDAGVTAAGGGVLSAEQLLIDPPMITPPLVTTAPPAGPIPMDGRAGVLARPSTMPSTSGGSSEHTRAQNWAGSNPSSEDGDGGGRDGDSGDSDMDHTQAPGLSGEGEAGGRARRGSSKGGGGGNKGEGRASSGVKKRRQRNAEQMESNRIAQQKYRQRKKGEQSALQTAVDLLTAQVAALKAVEVRNGELEAATAALQSTVSQQAAAITSLQQHTAGQAAELEATRAALGHSQQQVAAQHRIILDQGAKLRLQEQVIASLKDRLKDEIDEALKAVVPGTVCEKMVAAVKSTLYGAKDVSGLQDILSQLPEHLVHEICKNIWQVCKESWPEIRTRCATYGCPASSGMGTA
ncbi:hypothetical protein HYH02_004967 [Chlamydomonas schloesseri]|uniref:BZIP domain-containing protein n=1 Tax=Chlamydomonas schloesseri TaxID=2026947 RepID=A0A835WPQ5_9CHLO|nr:hypothetical protein HYH02_004967 [Chlamydomonas schloesseri]|eukprot:KAG2450465.1 hypothetical protein HYH02_004967 [Chlamydomonas schloesseri]